MSGVRVLDFTVIWAGPYGVMLMSDMGAEVIRVESCQHHIINTRGFLPRPTKDTVPTMGSLGRVYVNLDPGERPWDRHAIFNSLGRDRLSMTVDLRRPEGRQVVHDLVRLSDVLVHNQTQALLDKFGLDYATCRRLNPTMLYVSMPIFGLSGPYKDYMGFGFNAEGLAGFASLRGYRDGDPSSIGVSNHMDATSGVGVAYATLLALYQRQETGRGQLIEFCQIEHLMHQIGGPLMDAAMNGRAQGPLGNRDALRAPQGVYPCKGRDRWLALSVGADHQWAALCQALGLAPLASDPAYAGNLARQARHDDIDRLIAGWTSQREAADVAETLQQAGVPAAIVANDKDVYGDPQLDARGFFIWMDHPQCGRHRYPGHPFKYSGTPLRADAPAPLLGQHNDLVYRQLLGLPPAETARLTELGHIGDRYTEEAVRGG